MLKREKEEKVRELSELAHHYSIIGLLDMHTLPAKQLQLIRKKLRGKAEIRMTRRTLIEIALKQSKKNLDILIERVKRLREPALIFTNENPFRLYKFLKENKSPAPAKAGDIAAKDIIIPKGPTQLTPGPAISMLQKVGLKTSVQDGKIAIVNDKVVLKQGETVTPDIASVFRLLRMEPMEIGLNLVCVWEDGTIYDSNVLNVDEKEYVDKTNLAITRCINLSLNTGYLIPLTAEIGIINAFSKAKNLAINANVIEYDFIYDILAKATLQARALDEIIKGG